MTRQTEKNAKDLDPGKTSRPGMGFDGFQHADQGVHLEVKKFRTLEVPTSLPDGEGLNLHYAYAIPKRDVRESQSIAADEILKFAFNERRAEKYGLPRRVYPPGRKCNSCCLIVHTHSHGNRKP